MIQINLIPRHKQFKKNNNKQRILILISSLLIIYSIFWSADKIINNKMNKLKKSIEQTKAELNQSKKKIKKVELINKNLALLTAKTKFISYLEKQRVKPLLLFNSLTNLLIKKRMWFTKLTVSKDIVNISGIALDNRAIADFMKGIEQSQMFTNPKLKGVKQEKIQNLNVKSFIAAFNLAF